MDEQESLQKYPRLAQTYAFADLRYCISNFALDLLQKEWQSITQQTATPTALQVLSGGCSCEIILRFGIACKHHLFRAFRSGKPIPRSLVHPRWWIHGPIINFTDWHPKYVEEIETQPSSDVFFKTVGKTKREITKTCSGTWKRRKKPIPYPI